MLKEVSNKNNSQIHFGLGSLTSSIGSKFEGSFDIICSHVAIKELSEPIEW